MAVAVLPWPMQSVLAVTAADPSDVVLVFDVSGSIMDDRATRNEFADALDEIASRVRATSSDLVRGDATVSFVRFATKAADYPGCVGLKLQDSEQNIRNFADCLEQIAVDYRTGTTNQLERQLGNDTNYAAAMRAGARHLPETSPRPAMIFFTDGKHEAKGVSAAGVRRVQEELFGDRSPFALLPVGMGLEQADRDDLAAGLERLRIVEDMEPCDGQAVFEWPDVVFETAEAAGRAVAFAMQDVTCTAIAEPTPSPTPSPTPTPEAAPGAVRSISLEAGDGSMAVSWLAPQDGGTTPIEDYLVRCRTASGTDWIASGEGISTITEAEVSPLTNGESYVCEVAAVNATGAGAWSPSVGSAMPFGRPSTPARPTVQAKDGAAFVRATAPEGAAVTEFIYECSWDGGASWPIVQRHSASVEGTDVAGLQNGVEHVCRAIAANVRGASDPSAASDTFMPCGTLLECNPLAIPVIGLLLALLVLLLLAALWRWWVGRTRAWISASVDDYDAVTLGRGPDVGLTFVRSLDGGTATDVIVDPSPNADVRVRYKGSDRFEVIAAGAVVPAVSGRMVEVVDTSGERHSVLLRASEAPPRRYATAGDGDSWSDASGGASSQAASSSDSPWD